MASPTQHHIFCRYAVAFESEGAPAAGALLVTDQGVVLSGRWHGEPLELTIPRDELAGVRIGRTNRERLNGYSTVVLERRNGPDVLVAPFGFGLLHEIAELVASINAEPVLSSERLELIIPIRRGTHEQVRRLVASGPPFDPAELGLTRHDVYLDRHHVRFLFESPDAHWALQQVLDQASLWRAGLAWSRLIAGRPQVDEHPDRPPVGELIYSWRC
jgi:hypothetical protein